MGWLWAVLLPHPPVIIPEVGGGRQDNAEATIRGVKRIMDRLRGAIPDRLLVLSPHGDYVPNMLCANTASFMSGSLAPFGAENVRLTTRNTPEAFTDLIAHIEQHIPVAQKKRADITRDHGALVPLSFFQKAWQKLPEIYCFNPIGLSLQQAEKLGEILSQYDDGKSWGFLGSGDLSHRLTHDAPGGYHPAGKIFDKAVLASLMRGNTQPLQELSAKDLYNAGECGCRSVFTLLGLTGEPVEIMSYEGPFGVGYCAALTVRVNRCQRLTGTSQTDGGLSRHLPIVARLAIASHLSGEEVAAEALSNALECMSEEERKMLEAPGACFVTIKDLHGNLRGCIGTFLPARESLLQEILDNAVAAASRDPRFPVLEIEEFGNVTLSVDVLGAPEVVTDVSTLNPKKYGVIVTKNGRRGLLLPALEGVETVDMQLSIAARKAGIDSLEGADIMRFTVDRYYEVG